jgi:MFS family permease
MNSPGNFESPNPDPRGSWILSLIRRRFQLKESRVIRVIPFAMDLVINLFFVAAPLKAIHLGANPVELGLIGTLMAACHIIFSTVSGRLSDRIGRRILIVTSPILFALTNVLMILASRVEAILGLALLNGIALGLFWSPFQAWVADTQSGRGLARDIGSFNMSWTVAHLTGPTISGFLFSLFSWLPFLFSAMLATILILVTFASIENRRSALRSPIDLHPSKEEPGPIGFLYAAWVANFTSWFILANARYQFPKLAWELSIGPLVIGLLIGFVGLAEFLTFFFLRMSGRWYFKKSPLFGAQLLGALGMAAMYWGKSELLFALAFLLIGICCGSTYYSSLYYTVLLQKKKGMGTGLHESIVGSGALLGPILGGIAAQGFGLRAPYALAFFVLLLAMTVEWNLLRNPSAKNREIRSSS